MGIATSLAETRSTLANPDAWVRRWFGALPDTYTGKEVNHSTALTYSGWAAGVLLISETFGTLPRRLRRTVKIEGREASEVVRNHPLDYVLSIQANPEMDAWEFWAMSESHLLSDGNFYAQKVYDEGQRIRELWPLEPSRMQVLREGDELRYLYRTEGRERAFRRDEIFHLRGLSRDGKKGIAPLELARQAIGMGLAVEEYAARFFSNSATPTGALRTDGTLGEKAFNRLKSDWERLYQGQENAHKTVILEEGLQFQPIGISPKDSQMLDLRKFQVTEIARIIRVPPHLLQDLDRATFNNIEELGIGFVKYSLVHRCVRLEQAISSQLLSESDRKRLYVKHNLKGLLRGDTQKQGEFYKIGLEGGWLSPNDIRELEDLSPISDGDLYTQQLQRAPLAVIAQAKPAGETTPEEPPEAEEQEDDEEENSRAELRAVGIKERQSLQKSFEPLIRDAAERLVKLDTGLILQQGLKVLRDKGRAEFVLWLEAHEERLRDEAAKRLRSALKTYGETIARAAAKEIDAGVDESAVRDAIEALIVAFAARYAASTVRQIEALLTQSDESGTDPEEEIKTRLEEWKDTRPGKIGKGQAVGFGSLIAKTTMVAAGVSAFRWVTSGENCPLCSAMDGRVIRGDQPFLGARETLEAEGTAPLTPSRPVLSPPLHAGCDCTIAPD